MERPVLRYPDPTLRESAAPVTVFDETVVALARDLVDTLRANAPAVGLSAPQLGDLRQVLVIDLSDDGSDPQVYVNPRIVARHQLALVEEGCLSVPGLIIRRFRPTKLRIRAQAPSGEPFERDVEAMHAVCLQHEMEHFDGQLIVDRLWAPRRWWFDRQQRASQPRAAAG